MQRHSLLSPQSILFLCRIFSNPFLLCLQRSDQVLQTSFCLQLLFALSQVHHGYALRLAEELVALSVLYFD